MLDKILNSIKALFEGLFTVMLHLFRKSVTMEYPEHKPVLNEFFRGKHFLQDCIGCGVCQKVCPSDAIKIIKTNNKLDKYIIDFNKCIFCGNCMYYCPRKSMSMSNEFELSTPNKPEMLVEIENRRA